MSPFVSFGGQFYLSLVIPIVLTGWVISKLSKTQYIHSRLVRHFLLVLVSGPLYVIGTMLVFSVLQVLHFGVKDSSGWGSFGILMYSFLCAPIAMILTLLYLEVRAKPKNQTDMQYIPTALGETFIIASSIGTLVYLIINYELYDFII